MHACMCTHNFALHDKHPGIIIIITLQKWKLLIANSEQYTDFRMFEIDDR